MPAAKSPAPYILQEPFVVRLSDEERVSGGMNQLNMGEAVAAFHRDGLVVLENAVEIDHMKKLNDVLSHEAADMATLPTTHFNDNGTGEEPTGNMSQGPPLTPDLMFTDIWANKLASAVISNIIGPNPTVNYVNGNTALGGFKGRQRVHADLTFNHGTFPFAIVANYYLIDVSPANGSTELWLGTHRDTTFRDHRNCKTLDDLSQGNGGNGSVQKLDKASESTFGIREELLEKRSVIAPPIQPTVKRGSVVLRDLRLWHAGLPNPTPDPRIMLAFVHTPSWYQCPARVVLPESSRPLIEAWGQRRQDPVQYDAHFVPEGLDHKSVKFNPNFSSGNTGYQKFLPKGLDKGFTYEAESDH
ncbi:hypothetical protein ACHAQA_005685 [Verticillium albo-atrum]